jgi:hypothetical protein
MRLLPGIILQGADGKTDAALFAVNVDDLDVDFLTDFEHFLGMCDMVPGDFGEVDETIGSVDVDEGAEVCEAGDATGVGLAFFQFADDTFFQFRTGFVAGSTLREDEAAAFAVHFNDADGDRLTDHLLVALFGLVACGLRAADSADLRGRE